MENCYAVAYILNIGQNMQALGQQMTERPLATGSCKSGKSVWAIGLALFISGSIGNMVAMAFASASILVPLPMTNTVPGFGVAIASFGLMQKDGLMVIGGLIIGVGEKVAEVYAGPFVGGAIENWFAYMLALVFLLIRPQQQRAKKHAAMVEAVKRGDTVVTSGDLIGKVTKAGEAELTVELADNVRVQIVKQMVIEVRGKKEPVAAND